MERSDIRDKIRRWSDTGLNFVPGGTYFFTVTLADRTSSALVHHVSALRMAFRIARHERPFTIEAIMILPEHLHAIWTLPSGDSDFSGRWKRIKAYFTHRLAAAGVPVTRHRNGEYALWQRRFREHTIRNEIDFERHVDYVHFNPVKHKLVSRAREWPYSSFHVYVRRGLLPADWAGDVDELMMDFGERRG
jgi:putative transposase